MKKTLAVTLALSVVLNIVLAAGWLNRELMGYAETPGGKLGVLTRDLSVGQFDESSERFTLPKGLSVRDASASGMGWFEPHRFRIVVTSDDATLVDYSATPEKDSEYYSADIHLRASVRDEPNGALQ